MTYSSIYSGSEISNSLGVQDMPSESRLLQRREKPVVIRYFHVTALVGSTDYLVHSKPALAFTSGTLYFYLLSPRWAHLANHDLSICLYMAQALTLAFLYPLWCCYCF